MEIIYTCNILKIVLDFSCPIKFCHMKILFHAHVSLFHAYIYVYTVHSAHEVRTIPLVSCMTSKRNNITFIQTGHIPFTHIWYML